MKYDIIIVGSGPGGYVAAIRSAQLGHKVAIVEKESLGGICLNWGCIPTKALLKSAQVFNYLKEADKYGIEVEGVSTNFSTVVQRSRDVASTMSKGVNFLMKKNKIEVIKGTAKVKPNKKVQITNEKNEVSEIEGKNIILATGARSRELPNLPQDGKKIIGYREALSMKEKPESMIVVGSGAIGVEFAYFFNSMGTKVHLVEYMPNIVPVEDVDVSSQLEKSFKKSGIKVQTSSSLESFELAGDKVKAYIKTSKGEETIEADVILSAVGIKSNIEGIGLEEVGIKVEKDKVEVDEYYKTNVEGYYAIGDIVKGPALAHLASAEGITCVEAISGLKPSLINYENIPGCTYCNPEVASVGYTEKQAKEKGYEVRVGKFPFSASGKAQASGAADGFVKVIFDKKYGEWLGCHMIGNNVTEIIAEAVVARNLETTGHEILKSIHPHPTMSEAVMEAVAAAYDEVIHL